VLVLSRAKKSGVALYATLLFWEGDREAMRIEVPDYALDVHTARGRRMGRGRRHFVEEAGRLENETLENPYFEEGAAAWTQEAPASEQSSDQLDLDS
jgi:hypothetical protein